MSCKRFLSVLLLPLLLAPLAACSDDDGDPCDEAQVLLDSWENDYGLSDYSCVSDADDGVTVEVWCCASGRRYVHYVFRDEAGCHEFGVAEYDCNSTDLPPSVKAELESGGQPPPCAPLLDGTECIN